MSALSRYLRSAEGDRISFWCPGCEEMHVISVAPGRWGYNGNPEAPTFTPSILVRSGHYMPGHTGRCWCDYVKEHPEKAEDCFTCEQCHSFVTDGQIQFLDDCTHDLKGQTVPLPPLPNWAVTEPAEKSDAK